jgi:ABC-type branched-subunit amino acid transport system ATPase component
LTTLVEARRLCAGYGEMAVVRDLDLAVHAGEVVTLLGPNGAGKTTTVMTLAGALRPLQGEVLMLGRATTARLDQRVRAGLGLVTERRAVLMEMTVAENLRVNRGDFDLALSLFPELSDHLRRRVGLLSGGQQQMLALARALSRRPKLLIADELSQGLAPVIVSRLLSAIRAAADEGIGVLLVEQQVHAALQYADRGYVLRRGQLELEASASELRERLDEIESSYLRGKPSQAPGRTLGPQGAS